MYPRLIEKLEMKLGLLLMVAGVIAMAYAVSQANLWAAGLLAVSLALLFWFYRARRRTTD